MSSIEEEFMDIPAYKAAPLDGLGVMGHIQPLLDELGLDEDYLYSLTIEYDGITANVFEPDENGNIAAVGEGSEHLRMRRIHWPLTHFAKKN